MQIIGFHLLTALWDRYDYSNFTDEEIDAQKSRDLPKTTFVVSTFKLNTFYYEPHPWPTFHGFKGKLVHYKYVK